MAFEKRVHIVPIGYEIDRVIEPIIEDSAHTVYLLTNDEVMSNKNKRGHYCLEQVTKSLESRISEVNVISLGSKEDFFNFYKLMSELCFLVRKESEVNGTEVSINISAGSTISGIAGALVAQSYEALAYYSEPEKYIEGYGEDCQFYSDSKCTFSKIDTGHKYLPVTKGIKDNTILPMFGILPPDDNLLHALKIISGFPAGTTQENIIVTLINENLGTENDKKDFDVRGFSDKLRSRFRRRYFNKLTEDGLIKRIGSKRNPRWAITDHGKMQLDMFWKAAEYVITSKNSQTT